MAREEDGFFDDLARGLADGSITRGKALRLMGAALVGGALGSVGIGEASADPIGCKRNGKTCTRNVQCCSGNCSSGTCQAQTTTTTPTTTTSTTTSTTSTSTTTSSTTSTTTTPGCIPDKSICSTNGQCCSGYCAGGTCAPCPADRVVLSNGSCVKPCGVFTDCDAGCECVTSASDPTGNTGYCTGGVPSDSSPCTTDSVCPRGEFCVGAPIGVQCVTTC
jgi:hypothetical protein